MTTQKYICGFSKTTLGLLPPGQLNATYFKSSIFDEVDAWDAEAWLEIFRDAEKAENFNVVKALRCLEFSHTYHLLKRGFFRLGGAEYPLSKVPVHTTCYNDLPIVPALEDASNATECRVQVVEQDCLEAAAELVQEGYTVGVLNMASSTSPGGGVTHGAGAQEEYLHRTSNYALWAAKLRSRDLKEGYAGDEPPYPMPTPYSVYATKNVSVFRGSEAQGYCLQKPFSVTMLACAAINSPQLIEEALEGGSNHARLCSADVRLTQLKLAAVLSAAAQEGCDAVVLSAFGCGAFKNPPDNIAEIMQSVVSRFRFHFKTISIAVIRDHNSQQNIADVFMEEFARNTAVADVQPDAPTQFFSQVPTKTDGNGLLARELYATSDPVYVPRQSASQKVLSSQQTAAIWRWPDDKQQWNPYDEPFQSALEKGLSDGDAEVDVGGGRCVKVGELIEESQEQVQLETSPGQYERFRVQYYRQYMKTNVHRNRKVQRLIKVAKA